ncbi:MAG: hypothetical protein LBN29_11255 [Mediterranea sp.]|jgi:hypothetical protein|nr:hypothetical protein [Mediterranea sp.]
MEKKELSSLPDLVTIGGGDKLLAHNTATGMNGWLPASLLTRGGYAARRWNVNHASPKGEAYGDIDYLRDLPGLLGLGCYLVSPNREFRKLDPTDHHKLATGEPAALDGTMGDYMWCWNTHYYAFWTEGEWYYEAVSLKPIPGRENYRVPRGGISALSGGVIDREKGTLCSVVSNEPRYRGGDNDASKDGAYNTLLGRIATNIASSAFSAYARKKGEGWEAGWFTHLAVVGYLFRVIFGTRDVQEDFSPDKDKDGLYQGGLGLGNGLSYAWWQPHFDQWPFMPTSAGVELADACGRTTYAVTGNDGTVVATVKIPCFFGLKSFYGSNLLMENGLLGVPDNDHGYIYVARSWYDGANLYTTPNEKMVKAASYPLTNGTAQFISKISMRNLCHFPTEIGATASTGYADSLKTANIGGPFVAQRTLDTSKGENCGLEATRLLSTYQFVSKYATSPLCVTSEDVVPIPFLAD